MSKTWRDTRRARGEETPSAKKPRDENRREYDSLRRSVHAVAREAVKVRV
jgi:hypothetical protein